MRVGARNIADIMFDDTTYYDDDSLCVMPEARIGKSEPTSFIAPSEESDPNIKVYPIPFSSDLTVECIGCTNDLLNYELYSTTGVLTQKGVIIEKRINAVRLVPGLYFIKVISDKQVLYSGKIVKQ